MSERVVNSDTPFSKGRANSHHTYSLGSPEEGRATIHQYRVEIAEDMAYAAVRAEKDTFYEKYFPIPDNPSPNKQKPVLTANPFLDIPKSMGSEGKLCKKFAEIINDWNLIPGLVFRECSHRPDPLYVDPNKQRVDAAWYFERDVRNEHKQEWGDQIIPVEFKLVDDPFDDKKDNVTTPTEKRESARGQCITYSELIHSIQQRTAVFMLIIIGRRARFTRWDRSGTVVTRAFDYVDNWEFFCDILWRIGNCTEAQLGLDPTATRIYDDDADYLTMFNATDMKKDTVDHSEREIKDGTLPKGEFTYVRQMFKQSLKDKWPRYRVEVPDGDRTRQFLIGKPAFRARGMAGRGTRGYVALDCETGRFVWLKDAWRANYDFVRKEGDILADLNAAKIASVPTLVCHGDIAGQATETPDWWLRKQSEPECSTPDSSTTDSSHTLVNPSSSSSAKRPREDEDEEAPKEEPRGPLRLHTHYRLVVQEVAMPLSRFETPQQLVRVMLDCIYAHYEAATNLEKPLLHRDISSGNILIYPRVIPSQDGGPAFLTWTGILADWEMSKSIHVGTSPRKPRQPERTGTWQYLSVALLAPGNRFITIADELESFFHVLIYFALRYVKTSNCDGESVADFLDRYFDLYGKEKGMFICGALKRSTMVLGAICVGSSTVPRFDNPLDKLFVKLLSWFRARYLLLTHETNKPSATSQAAPTVDTTADKLSANYARRLNIRGKFGPSKDTSKKTEGPSEEDRTLAAFLDTHEEILIAFDEAAFGHPWPKQRAEDQIPAGWQPPQGERFQHEPSKIVEHKRARMALETQSEPPMPLVTPRPPHTPQRRTVQSLDFTRAVLDSGSHVDSSSSPGKDADPDYVDERES